jgi:hypothetical protein
MEHLSELKFFHPQGFARCPCALTTNGRLFLIRQEKEPWHHASHCHEEWEVPCWSEKTQYSERGYLPWDVVSLEIYEYNIIILSYTQTLVSPPAEAAKSWPYMYSHKTQGIHCCCLLIPYTCIWANPEGKKPHFNLWLIGIESRHGWFAPSIFAIVEVSWLLGSEREREREFLWSCNWALSWLFIDQLSWKL